MTKKSQFRSLAAAADAAYAMYRSNPATEPELWETLSRMARNLAESHFKGPNEDATQDGLVDLLEALKSGQYAPQPGARFSTWVGRVLKHSFLDHTRGQAAENKHMALDDLPPAIFQKLAARDSHETKLFLENAISKLSDKTQEVVKLRLAGESFEAIAKKLFIAKTAAKQRWIRATKQLQA